MTKRVSRPEVTLVVPVHRDSPKTRQFLDDLSSVWPDSWPAVIVDNGSGVDFSRFLSPRFHLLVLPLNVGFGGAVRSSLDHIESQHIVWCPGNGKVPAGELVAFSTRAVVTEAVLVKATRRGRLLSYSVKSFVAGLFHSVMLKTNMFDSGGTPSLARLDFLREVCWGDDGPEFDAWILFVAQRMGLTCKRIPVRYNDSRLRESSWRRGFSSEIELFAKILNFKNRKAGAT